MIGYQPARLVHVECCTDGGEPSPVGFLLSGFSQTASDLLVAPCLYGRCLRLVDNPAVAGTSQLASHNIPRAVVAEDHQRLRRRWLRPRVATRNGLSHLEGKDDEKIASLRTHRPPIPLALGSEQYALITGNLLVFYYSKKAIINVLLGSRRWLSLEVHACEIGDESDDWRHPRPVSCAAGRRS